MPLRSLGLAQNGPPAHSHRQISPAPRECLRKSFLAPTAILFAVGKILERLLTPRPADESRRRLNAAGLWCNSYDDSLVLLERQRAIDLQRTIFIRGFDWQSVD